MVVICCIQYRNQFLSNHSARIFWMRLRIQFFPALWWAEYWMQQVATIGCNKLQSLDATCHIQYSIRHIWMRQVASNSLSYVVTDRVLDATSRNHWMLLVVSKIFPRYSGIRIGCDKLHPICFPTLWRLVASNSLSRVMASRVLDASHRRVVSKMCSGSFLRHLTTDPLCPC